MGELLLQPLPRQPQERGWQQTLFGFAGDVDPHRRLQHQHRVRALLRFPLGPSANALAARDLHQHRSTDLYIHIGRVARERWPENGRVSCHIHDCHQRDVAHELDGRRVQKVSHGARDHCGLDGLATVRGQRQYAACALAREGSAELQVWL